MAHFGNGWVFSNANGGWLYLIVISIVVALQAPTRRRAGAVSETPAASS